MKLKTATSAKPTKFWDLYRDGVTQSFINKFLTCKEQCRLEYVEGWTPKTEPIWFTFGKLIHHVLSEAYALGKVPTPLEVKNFILAYEKKLNIDAKDFQTKEIIFGIAEMLLPIYFIKYKEDFSSRMHFNESNFRINANLPYLSSDIPVNGRFDGGFVKENKLRMLDTKCLSLIDDDLGSSLPFDTQVMLYCWAAKQLHPELELKSFILNIIRRPSHKIKKDEPIKDFCQRVIKDVMSRMEDFFIRIEIPILEKELQEWEQNFLIPVLIEIERWYNDDCRSYVNGQALITKYGHCAMFDIITKGDYTNFYKRSKPFGELE